MANGNVTNDWAKASKAIDNADLIEVPESTDVFSWSPSPPGTANAKCTQVHLHFKTSIGTMFVRFKGPGSLDALIEALQEHRANVWGDPAKSVIPGK